MGYFAIFAKWNACPREYQGIHRGSFICKKKAAGMLALFLIICVILCPMGVDAATREDAGRLHIRIAVRDQDFSAELYDNETTRAWAGQMPMTLEMSELNGNEKYHYFSESLPTNPEKPDAIHTGDLMLYGQSCLVLFYKDFVTSYSYTPLGYMEDAAGLAKALGNGNVTVSFRLDGEELPDGKEELRKLYDEEKATPNQGYTAQSWMAFEDALEVAKNILEDKNTTAENVQDAIKSMKNAKKGLVTLDSMLEREIQSYSKTDSDGDNYTEESWNAYRDALKEAEELKQAGGYTEEAMNQKIAALKSAYEGLELQTFPKLPESSNEQPEQRTPVKPSEQESKQPEQKPSVKPSEPKAEQPGPKQVKVREIRLAGNLVKLAKGRNVKLNANVSPENASNKGLKWTSSDKKVAVVTADGIVTGKKKGTATITAEATDGSGIKGRYKITVLPHAVKKITLNCRTKSLAVGKKVKVAASVSATGKIANKKLVWSTSNKKYATVNANGKATAKKAGRGKTVLITAKATDGSGKKASIKIRIKA